MTASSPPNQPKRSLRELLRQILLVQESPQRTAFAFAVGVFIAFFPAYGLHTGMVLLCAWLFQLNLIALMAGAFLNNPWTVVPILGATYWVGAWIMGRTETPAFDWHDLSFLGLYHQILPYAIPFALGGLVLSVAGAVVAYPLAYRLISKYRAGSASLVPPQPLPPSDPVG